MPSEVTICNLALLSLGANEITSLDDATREAKLCKVHYEPARMAVQEENPWTFCTRWETLAELADPPESEFANGYQKPADSLRILFVGQDYENPEVYRVEGQAIVTNATVAKAQLIYDEPDPSKFSPLFVQALAARLAMEMAMPITESRSTAEYHARLYGAKMRDAKSRDNAQGTPRRIRSSWLLQSRYTGVKYFGPTV